MNPKIIKQQSSEAAGPDVPAARILRNDAFVATSDARSILDAARQRADAILREAEREREQMIEAARQQGYREGLKQWNEAVLAARTAAEEAAIRHETELVRLAVRAAGKIVGQELRTHPDAIATIVRECMKNVRSERLLIIQVNPEDAAHVRNNVERLASLAGPARQIDVVADPGVSRGGCIVESEFGIVDARLETQLQCLEDVLVRAARG